MRVLVAALCCVGWLSLAGCDLGGLFEVEINRCEPLDSAIWVEKTDSTNAGLYVYKTVCP